MSLRCTILRLACSRRLAFALLVVAALVGFTAPGGARAAAGAAGQEAASSTWKSAAPGRVISLPADHASHPEYKLEWWYYTGNLDGPKGERFGFQVTFFRVGIDANPVNRSRWAVRDLFMTHVAITDANGRQYLFTERLNRGGPGWAGAETDRYRVWNEDWEASLDGRIHRIKASGVGRSGARDKKDRGTPFSLDLALEENMPPALHGDRGYSRKGSDPANASHYYSLPRMPTRGSVTINGTRYAVTGLSWMDHEFGTSFLEAGQIGWDWFAVQLSDGRSLMLYRFRRSDNGLDPRSSGTLIDASGRTTPVDFSRVTMAQQRTWTSPFSRAAYPVTWQLTLPGERLVLTTGSILDDQELQTGETTGVTYWEGAIDVTGTSDGKPITGRGYLEMTGYTGAPMTNYLR